MAYRQSEPQRRNDSVHFDLIEHIGVLSLKDTGWKREVNLVSWNGGEAKVDIREWAPDHKRMGKGATLFEEEAETLTRILAKRYGFTLAERTPARRTFMTEEDGLLKGEPAESTAENTAAAAGSSAIPDDPGQLSAAVPESTDQLSPVSEAAAARVAENVLHMNEAAPAMA